MLGADWRAAWDRFDEMPSTDTNNILAAYRNQCVGLQAGLAAASVSEPTYQAAFGALAEAVQENVTAQSGTPALYWFDTHRANIKRPEGTPRKPDGCFSVDPVRHEWQDIAVVVEIKDHLMDGTADHPRGQIVQDMIDMAEINPRRFMLGLTLGKGHAIHLYVCVPGGIYIAELGSLPSAASDDPNEHERRVVAFLLFLHRQYRNDRGYLTAERICIPDSFALANIVGAATDARIIHPSWRTVSLTPDNGVLGRHRHLKGQRTWVYSAKVTSPKST
ncbi:hypothetical protein GGI23_004252, partial [Coemansia sp. RSA 2559]